MAKILFVGLGRMGANMAAHLSRDEQQEGYVHNRSKSKVNDWLSTNRGLAFDPNLHYDAVILCVGNDNDVRGLLGGETKLLNCVAENGTVIDHSTTSAQLAKEMSDMASQQNVAFLDAPVSGGEAGAVNGTLSCMLGGDGAAVNAVRPLLDNYCSNVVHIGESGTGQLAKMANQFCIAGTLAGLSEAINLLHNEKVDAENVFQAIKGGAAQSWQMDNRFNTMLEGEFDFGFAIDHMIKDLGYALQQAQQQGWNASMSSMVLDWYQALSKQGCSTQDTSALIKHYG